jgi:hypothetical protein
MNKSATRECQIPPPDPRVAGYLCWHEQSTASMPNTVRSGYTFRAILVIYGAY